MHLNDNERRDRKVPQCESCKKKNVLAIYKEGQDAPVCNKCGEYPGFISSVRTCPHDPIHSWEERGECKKSIAIAPRKRRKEVFGTDEIPHLWMHAWRSQGNARNALGNLYFQQETIYSYGSHFPIARHVENKKGKSAILFTTATYSVTTSRHMQAVRQAIPPGYLIFNVPHLDTTSSYHGDKHKLNLQNYQTKIDRNLLRSARARSSYVKESSHEYAVKLRAERNAYVKFFALKNKPLPAVPKMDSKGMNAIKAKEKIRQAAEAVKNKARQAQRDAEAAEYAKGLETVVEDWRNNVPNPVHLPYGIPTMLRIRASEDGAEREVETSKGARIPVSHAIAALATVRKVMARGEAFVTNGHTIKVGVYQIERIEVDGTIKAGCHVITASEWERIAPALDAYKPEPNSDAAMAEAQEELGLSF